MADDVSVRFGADTSDLKQTIQETRSLLANLSDTLKSAFTGVNTSQAQASIKAVGDEAKAAGENTTGAFDKIKQSASDVTAGLAGLVEKAVDYLTGVADKAVQFDAEIRKSSGAFDQTTATMSEVKSLADRAGLSLTALGNSFFELQKNAKSGNDATVAALGALGLKAQDIAGLTQDAIAVKMAAAFAGSADSANKAATAVALFGSDVASKLVPQLDQGAARIRDLEDAANRTGTAIGPDLQSKIDGTNSVVQQMKDRMQELHQAFDGMMLQSFVQYKPAIDGIREAFSDVIKNVTDLIEYFKDLDGAGQKNTQSMGLLATATQLFARGIIEATNYVEELAVKGVQEIANLGVSFDGLSKVAIAFGEDVKTMASAAANELYAAFQAAINGVIALFGDLAEAGKAALSFDLSGVGSAFSKFGSDVADTSNKIKAALGPDLLSNSHKAWDDMQAGAAASAKALDAVLAKLEAQKKAQLDMLAAGGAKAAPAGTKAVGDPAVKADDDEDGNNDKLRAAMKEIDGEVKALQGGLKEKTTILDAEVAQQRISQNAKFAALETYTQQAYEAELALYQKELGLDGLSLTQKQDINNKIKALQTKHNEDMLKLDVEAVAASQKTWQGYFDTIQSEFNGQLKGLLAGTTSFASAMKTIAGDLIIKLIEGIEKWAFQWAAAELANTTASTTGAAARASANVSADSAISLSAMGSMLKSITASAAETFAGIFGFLSPLLGPAAAGPAAAGQATVMAAAASIPSFDIGAWNLPADMLANVHAGEMIVPAGPAAAMRNAMNNAGAGGASTSGGDLHTHFHVTAMDSRDVRRFFSDNSKHILGAINDGLRSGSHLGLSKLRSPVGV